MQAEDIQRLKSIQRQAELVEPKAQAVYRVLQEIIEQSNSITEQIEHCDMVELQQMLERLTNVSRKLKQCGTIG